MIEIGKNFKNKKVELITKSTPTNSRKRSKTNGNLILTFKLKIITKNKITLNNKID